MMPDSTEPTAAHERCPICRHIPEHKFVETLHTEARLPEQVDQLEVLGGYGFHGYGNEQVRKCPLCKTYYTYLYDHDSESGVGIGWTDQEIQRITPESALDVMERILQTWRGARECWPKLVQEIASLKKLLGRGE